MRNCEIELDLSWTKDYVLIEFHDNVTGINFMITGTKRYVSVVTLCINDNVKFIENIKQGFKRTVSWNKYRSEITAQTKNNLDYLIDPTFRNINGLFVLSFKNGNDDFIRDSFDEYYMPLVEIKGFNALIDNPLFDQPAKSKQEPHEKLVQMSRNNDYITGNILDYLYHQKYKLAGVYLSRQKNISIHQKDNFTGELEEENVQQCFLLLKSSNKLF